MILLDVVLATHRHFESPQKDPFVAVNADALARQIVALRDP